MICTDNTEQPKCEFNSMVVPRVEEMVTANTRSCRFVDDDECSLTFVYGFRDYTGELQVGINTDLTTSCLDPGVGAGDKGMWQF